MTFKKFIYAMKSDMRLQLLIGVSLLIFRTGFCHLDNVCTNFKAYGDIFKIRECSYNPDLFSTTGEIIKRHGYPLQEYRVSSGDKFYLRIFRIPYSPKSDKMTNRKPIFLQHGSVSNSELFVLPGKSSMALHLSDMGYDVWLGNARGTFYSYPIHKQNELKKSYWDYTLDDMSVEDIPPTLELIANITGKPGELIFVGHSSGTTEGMIYNLRMQAHARKHVKAFIYVGPIAYINDNLLMKIVKTMVRMGFYTIAARSKIPAEFCSLDYSTWEFCIFAINSIIGPDDHNFPPEETPLMIGGTDIMSLKALNQFAQNAGKNQFRAYRFKGESSSQAYNVKHIKIPTYLIVGKNDRLATYNNALETIGQLGSKHKKLYAIDNCNHMNYFYSKSLNVSFIPPFDDALNRIAKL